MLIDYLETYLYLAYLKILLFRDGESFSLSKNNQYNLNFLTIFYLEIEYNSSTDHD